MTYLYFIRNYNFVKLRLQPKKIGYFYSNFGDVIKTKLKFLEKNRIKKPSLDRFIENKISLNEEDLKFLTAIFFDTFQIKNDEVIFSGRIDEDLIPSKLKTKLAILWNIYGINIILKLKKKDIIKLLTAIHDLKEIYPFVDEEKEQIFNLLDSFHYFIWPTQDIYFINKSYQNFNEEIMEGGYFLDEKNRLFLLT
jgi:hypothetical protein